MKPACMALAGALALLSMSCADTGQSPAEIPLYLAGTEIAEPLDFDGVEVTLERTQLAFGPLYLCAGTQAGEFCDNARLEWLDTTVVDVLDGSPELVGLLEGSTGSVQSYMYDLGISSQLTGADPVTLSAAETLGGVSLVVEGSVRGGNRESAFFAHIPLEQTSKTELGVPLVRKSATDSFEHDVTNDDAGLLIRFDIRPWLTGIDFETFLSGEREPFEITPESAAGRALSVGVIAGSRPSFEWLAQPQSL